MDYFIINLTSKNVREHSTYNFWIKARGLMRSGAHYLITFETAKDLLYSKEYAHEDADEQIPMLTFEGYLQLDVGHDEIEGVMPYSEKLWNDIKEHDA